MISGVFRAGHPCTAITVYGGAAPQELEFIVDTGFEGDLALPSHVAFAICGTAAGVRRRVLANSAAINCRLYRASIEWSPARVGLRSWSWRGGHCLGPLYLTDTSSRSRSPKAAKCWWSRSEHPARGEVPSSDPQCR